MFITSIRLQNFKSYSDSSFEFEPGVNIIVGPNASGKTNLLEGLFIALRGKSFKALTKDTVKYGTSWLKIEAVTESSQIRTFKAALKNNNLDKQLLINNKPLANNDKDKLLPCVVFEPSYLNLLTTSPEQRRHYLDSLIEQVDPSFTRLFADYSRVLRQRNALLKKHQQNRAKQIFAWDVRLSQLAEQYVNKRIELITQINKKFTDTYSSLANKKTSVSLEYFSTPSAENYASTLLKELEKKFELDSIRGYTSIGPHRDDIIITLNNKDIKVSASRGETRTILLALKIIEIDLLKEAYNKNPLLLLDDVFSELDGARRKQLVERLSNHQAFITTTDADLATSLFSHKSNIYIITTAS